MGEGIKKKRTHFIKFYSSCSLITSAFCVFEDFPPRGTVKKPSKLNHGTQEGAVIAIMINHHTVQKKRIKKTFALFKILTSKNARGVKGNHNTRRFQGCVLLALFEVYIRYTARWLGCRVPFCSNIIIIIIIALLNYYHTKIITSCVLFPTNPSRPTPNSL